MIFTVAWWGGWILFIHYGWTAMRHDTKSSTIVFICNIYVIMIAIVLWLLFAHNQDLLGLCWVAMLAAFSQGCVHIYMWYYGLSFKKAAAKIHDMHIPAKDFWRQIKKCL